MSDPTALEGKRYIGQQRGKVRWCFGCRRRLAGTYYLHRDLSGYLGPFWVYRCDGCAKDRRWMF